jgi:hypothetical protein
MLLLVSFVSAAPVAPAPHDLVESLQNRFADPLGPGCLTPIVAALKDRADELSPEDRVTVSALLSPSRDFFAPLPERARDPVAPPSAPSASCWDIGENQLNSEHFSVQWDGDTIGESTAQGFLDALEDGWEVEIEELGWEAPLQTGTYLIPAYVQDGSYQGAYTTTERCGASYAPYIVAYSGSFSTGSWSDDMAVHEFNHSSQFSYGYGWEFWWWEATATTVQEQVYPNSNWWTTYVSGYAGNPQIAMNASDQNDQDIFWHMYGMSIWGNYIVENLGGHDTVLETWENSSRHARGYYDYGMEDAFDDAGLDLHAAYADFVAKNIVMDYHDQRYLPGVDERDQVDELPADGESSSRHAVQGYGQDFIRFDTDIGEGDILLTFDGQSDADWLVEMVEVTDSEVLRVAEMDVAGGMGELTFEDFGEEDVVLVISPMEPDDSSYDYAWTAELIVPEEDPVDSGLPSDDPGKVGNDSVEMSGGCGCDAGGNVGIGAGILLGMAAVARRRR